MGYRVFKFGGSSVADSHSISQVIDIISHNGVGLAVVVSAMKGVTDTLDHLAHQAVKGTRKNESDQLRQMRRNHEQVIGALIVTDEQEPYFRYLDQSIEELQAILESLAVLKELTAKALAKVVSYGERLMATILAQALVSRGLDAQFLDATELIKLTRQGGVFIPDADRSRQEVTAKLKPLLDKNKLVILPGFIGETEAGDVMTLGRGGSDYSATLLASLLRAESVTLYKEVDGLLTADPRYVPDTRVVPELHYREAAELAYYGAKILHPRSIIPLISEDIALIIKNTFNPVLPGTRIAGDVSPGAYPVKALTAVPQQAIIAVEGKGMMGVPGMAARTFGALANENISVSLITQASSESSICFVVPQSDADIASRILLEAFQYELEHQLIDEIKVIRNQCVIAIVGLGMNGTHGIAARTFDCIQKEMVNVNAIAQGSSELNISIVIEEDAMSKVLRALHHEYRLDRIKALYQRDSSEVNLLIHGLGQIGRALVEQIESQKRYFQEKIKIKAPIVSLIDSTACLFNDSGFDSADLEKCLTWKNSGKKLRDYKGSQALNQLQQHLETTTYHKGIFVDLTAEDSQKEIRSALEHNLHVVLANKKPLSIPYPEFKSLFTLADEKNLLIRYEATVGAGLPVLDTIEKLSLAGDEVLEILGCLSGTLGYIFTEVEDGASFSTAVRTAYEKGYTEPDPRDDLSGMDVARKALILARSLGIEINMEDIELEPLFPEIYSSPDPEQFIQNLKNLDQSFSERLQAASKASCVLRYVVRLNRKKVTVAIEAVGDSSPLGRLRGTANQVSIRTRRYDDNPLIVTGPGAGADVTAAGVLNDIIAIAASQERGS